MLKLLINQYNQQRRLYNNVIYFVKVFMKVVMTSRLL